MNLNWGTILVSSSLSGFSAIVVWFITNAMLGPRVERRKRLAEEKRKHAEELFPWARRRVSSKLGAALGWPGSYHPLAGSSVVTLCHATSLLVSAEHRMSATRLARE